MSDISTVEWVPPGHILTRCVVLEFHTLPDFDLPSIPQTFACPGQCVRRASFDEGCDMMEHVKWY